MHTKDSCKKKRKSNTGNTKVCNTGIVEVSILSCVYTHVMTDTSLTYADIVCCSGVTSIVNPISNYSHIHTQSVVCHWPLLMFIGQFVQTQNNLNN